MDKEQLKFGRQIHAWIAKLKILMTANKLRERTTQVLTRNTRKYCKKWSVDREGNWRSDERAKTLKAFDKLRQKVNTESFLARKVLRGTDLPDFVKIHAQN